MVDRRRIGKNSKQRGKAIERIVASFLGGKRNPDTGGKVADVETEQLVVEVKSLQSPGPVWLREGWAQAEQAAEQTGKTPLLVVSFVENGKRSYWEVQPLRKEQDA